MEHFNGILFHKSGSTNKQHTNLPTRQDSDRTRKVSSKKYFLEIATYSESKKSSIEWTNKGEGVPIKAKICLSGRVVLPAVFRVFKRFAHFLHEHRKFYYCQLSDEAKLAYRLKRLEFPIGNLILLRIITQSN